MSRVEQIRTTVPTEIFEVLNLYAQEERVSISWVIRDLLLKGYEEWKNGNHKVKDLEKGRRYWGQSTEGRIEKAREALKME